eukprot:6928-Pelagococcus_subviridis.AAC.7
MDFPSGDIAIDRIPPRCPSQSSIGRPGGDVVAVRVPRHDVHVREMPDHDPARRRDVHRPHARGLVVRRGREVMARRRPFHVPDRVVVRPVRAQRHLELHRPRPHGRVPRAREQELVPGAQAHRVHRGGVSDVLLAVQRRRYFRALRRYFAVAAAAFFFELLVVVVVVVVVAVGELIVPRLPALQPLSRRGVRVVLVRPARNGLVHVPHPDDGVLEPADDERGVRRRRRAD